MTAKKIALFIDADNISAKFGKQIFDVLESRGEIFIRRIYGNWQKPILHGWNDCILNFSLRPVQQPDFATGKNATDMSLTIDAMDVLHGGRAEVFALVSNDSDFTPLAIRLREGGMNVIGLGSAKVSSSFRAACSEFISLDNPAEVKIVNPTPEVVTKIPPAQSTPKVVKKSKPAQKNPSVQLSLFDDDKPQPAPSSKVVPITSQETLTDSAENIQALHDLFHEAAAVHGDENGFVPLCWAGQALSEKNLSVKKFGYGSLNKFVAAFPDLYEVIQRETGENFCYRCLKGEQKISDYRLNQLHNVLREVWTVHANAAGFVNLWWACNFIVSKKNLCREIKTLNHNRLCEFVSDFPNLYETAQIGQDFCYRCRTRDDTANPDDGRLKQLHKILREAATVHADKNGFADLSFAGSALVKKNLSIKGSGHSTLQKFIAAFPRLYEVQKTGTIVRYRCR